MNVSRIARHGTGIRAVIGALGSQVHPVFMLPPVASSLFGAILAGQFRPTTALPHAAAIFLAVYTAHLKDGYVDYYHRGEDHGHPITKQGCQILLATSSLAFFTVLTWIWLSVDTTAALLTLPTWLLAITHAPQLDTNPIGATVGYPLGVAIAIVGSYYIQTALIDPVALGFAVVFLSLLSGVKIIDDAQDYDHDRSISKRTVAVVVGSVRARNVAWVLMITALLLVLGFAGIGLFVPSTVIASLVFGVVLLTTHRTDDRLATMLLIRGSYVFLAVLIAAVWFQPFG